MNIKICVFDRTILLFEYVKPEDDCKKKGFFIVRKLEPNDDCIFETEEEVLKFVQDIQDVKNEDVIRSLESIQN